MAVLVLVIMVTVVVAATEAVTAAVAVPWGAARGDVKGVERARLDGRDAGYDSEGAAVDSRP
eukprot:894226-Rhodomonas_salina.1